MGPKIRIVLTGGGTAGHIYPLIAVARELSRRIIERGFESDIRFFGDPGAFGFELAAAGIRISKVPASKWRRYFDPQNFFDIFKFTAGVMVSLWKMYWFMPHVCFSKGGPGALSVLTATRLYAIPIILHESDTIPGITNRLTARSARVIELAFEHAAEYFNAKKTHLVGNPVLDELLGEGESRPAEEISRGARAAKIEFGFDPEKPVILFLGGSQGAERMNEFVLKNIRTLTEKFQVLHQTGRKNYESYQNEYLFVTKGDETLKQRYRFMPYFDKNLKNAYDAADVVVARAGAGTIFELAALGKPSILIPIPESANNHQVQNAYVYEKTGGTIVLEEENLHPALLLTTTEKILNDPARRQAMSEAAKKFYIPNAAQLITRDILSILGF